MDRARGGARLPERCGSQDGGRSGIDPDLDQEVAGPRPARITVDGIETMSPSAIRRVRGGAENRLLVDFLS